jgi:glycosyltransferase involved in cell wall biosynthesis
VLRRRPDARLWIAGRGPYEDELERLAGELGVVGRVEIHSIPAQDRAGMAEELARAKVVLLLSEFETQPLAALEALALGCRLIVAETPGLTELVEDGHARGVPLATSPEEVAAVVLEELDKQPVRNAPDLPTWDECADELSNLYETVTAAGRAS